MCHLSYVMCYVSPVTVICPQTSITYHLSHVICHLTTTLSSFGCYQIHRKLGNVAAVGLLINIV